MPARARLAEKSESITPGLNWMGECVTESQLSQENSRNDLLWLSEMRQGRQ